jgi:hypothetical protein
MTITTTTAEIVLLGQICPHSDPSDPNLICDFVMTAPTQPTKTDASTAFGFGAVCRNA